MKAYAMWGRRYIPFLALMAVLTVMLSGCAVRLAPDYNESFVARLNAINERVSTYFVGFDPSQAYAVRKDFYDETGGQMAALITALKARPMPQPAVLDWLGFSQAGSKVGELARNAEAPSIGAMESTMKELLYLRDSDRKGALTPAVVGLSKGMVDSFLTDALTYEMALRR